MSHWIDRYIQLATATHKRHILLHDRDGLLTHTDLRRAIEQLGYSLGRAETPWQVRIHYEVGISEGRQAMLLLVPSGYRPLPDIAADTHQVEVGLRDLFPLLDAAVLRGLPGSALTIISTTRQYHRLERDATLKWLLEHVYNVDVDSLRTSPDRNRIMQALRSVNEHPAGSNAAIRDYLQTLATPYRAEFARLMAEATAYLDHPTTIPDTWFERIATLGQAMRWALTWPDETFLTELNGLAPLLNDQFQVFLDSHYESLFSLSAGKRPAVVSRVLDYMRARPSEKKALIVIDGMNVWQGQLLAEGLTNAGLMPVVKTTMAYIPTITAWSRQALFRGSRPDLATDNHREGKLFEKYWQVAGLQANQIQYGKFTYAIPGPVLPLPTTVVRLGLVCNDLDDLMHGTIFGTSQLEQATQKWITNGPILPLITDLKKAGFNCYITADHGNLEAVGLKNLTSAEKVGAISRSKRHIHFANEALATSFVRENPTLHVGIRGRSIYLRDRSAFTIEQQTVVTHGGSHFWEVLVPFIEL